MKDSLGTAGDQGKVLKKLEEQRKEANILILRMPGYKSSEVTLSGYEFDRTSQSGCDLLVVKLSFQEVRITGKKRIVTKSGTPMEPDDMGHKIPQRIG